jgi:hypothetical protein
VVSAEKSGSRNDSLLLSTAPTGLAMPRKRGNKPWSLLGKLLGLRTQRLPISSRALPLSFVLSIGEARLIPFANYGGI